MSDRAYLTHLRDAFAAYTCGEEMGVADCLLQLAQAAERIADALETEDEGSPPEPPPAVSAPTLDVDATELDAPAPATLQGVWQPSMFTLRLLHTTAGAIVAHVQRDEGQDRWVYACTASRDANIGLGYAASAQLARDKAEAAVLDYISALPAEGEA